MKRTSIVSSDAPNGIKAHEEAGFIPLLIGVFLFVATLAYLVYLRVASAHQ
jgi:hypothetical protein